MGHAARRSAVLLGLFLCWGATGCAQLDVTLQGTLSTSLLEPAASTEDEPLVLAFDRLGNLTLNGHALELPSAREPRQFGLRVVDTTSLPPVWRPAHAQEGGILVASLLKASPLAIAGLRPFDRVVELNGAQPHSVEDCVESLQVPEGHEVTLVAVKPDGARRTLKVRAQGEVGNSLHVQVPLLFETQASTSGNSLGLGPLDGLFYYRNRVEQEYVLSAGQGHAAYREHFEWGCLGNVIYYETLIDKESGEAKKHLRLFWFLHLGDDL